MNKKTKFTRSNFISLGSIGIFSAIAIAVPLITKPAAAQTPLVISADGNLNEYSHETAPLLVRGSVTAAVKDVQLQLKELGFYYGDADSIFGPRTYSAVVSFQRSRNLPPTGIIEERTWEALIDADNRTAYVPTSNLNNISQYSSQEAPVLVIGSRGNAVKDIQAFLKQQGYYTGAIDGIYGRATATAVESFQQQYDNLNNDGIVGANTWDTIIDTARNPFAIN